MIGGARAAGDAQTALDAVFENRLVTLHDAAELLEQTAQGTHRLDRHETRAKTRHCHRLIADAEIGNRDRRAKPHTSSPISFIRSSSSTSAIMRSA